MSVLVGLKALVIWGTILVLAILNGVLREFVLVPQFGIAVSQIISGLLLSGLIFAVTYLLSPWLNSRGSRELIYVGFGWLFLTVIFEFSFGLSRGASLQDLLAAYTFKDGNIWPVVLLVTLFSPWLAGKLRGRE